MLTKIRPYIVPIIVGLLLGGTFAAPVIVQSRDADHAKTQRDAVVRQHQADLRRITELEAELADVRRTNDDLEQRLAAAAEASRAAKVRASRSRVRAATSVRTYEGAATTWAHSVFAIKVANCESADLQHWPYSDGTRYLGDAHLRDPNGHDGKWQFAPGTWRSVGGQGRAYDASEDEQDYRAWLLWKRDGWGPWACAKLV